MTTTGYKTVITMSKKHKRQSQTQVKELIAKEPVSEIDTQPTTTETPKTEPTMSDAITNALNTTSYLNALTKAMLLKGDGHAKISDIIETITNAKDSIAYKQSVAYSGYKAKTDITDAQQITKRVWGWAKYYSQQGRFDLNKETGDMTAIKGGY